MSRNEMFLLLACAFVAAIMAGAPDPLARQSPMTIASLVASPSDDIAWHATKVVQHGFDRQ